MSKQLHLIDTTPVAACRLDETTKQIGRKGIASAREALRHSRPRYAAPRAA